MPMPATDAAFREFRECATALPQRWVFRRGETVCATFAVALEWHPREARVVLYRQFGLVLKHKRAVACTWLGVYNRYRIAELRLEHLPMAAYRYALAFVDEAGVEHQAGPLRLFVVDDEVPRSLDDVDETTFCAEHGVMTGPVPTLAISAAPDDWGGRTLYSLIIDRFAIAAPVSCLQEGLLLGDRSTPAARHGGSLAGILARLPYLETLGIGVLLLSPIYCNPDFDLSRLPPHSSADGGPWHRQHG